MSVSTNLERYDDEPEIRYARRAYDKAQELLSGPQLTLVTSSVACAWHDFAIHPERGYFAVVDPDGPAEVADLVGQVLQVTYMRRSVFAYVIASRSVPESLSLQRTAFLKLAPLRLERITVVVRKVL